MKAPTQVKISHVKILEDKAHSHKVEIELHDYSKQVKVHVFASTFVANRSKLARDCMRLQQNKIASTEFRFAMWKNIFTDNHKLSDEMRYVLDRKDLDV